MRESVQLSGMASKPSGADSNYYCQLAYLCRRNTFVVMWPPFVPLLFASFPPAGDKVESFPELHGKNGCRLDYCQYFVGSASSVRKPLPKRATCARVDLPRCSVNC